MKSLLLAACAVVALSASAEAAQFAIYQRAVVIWSVTAPDPSPGRKVERDVIKQASSFFSTLIACQEDLKNKITPHLASVAHDVATFVQSSALYNNPNAHLVAPRDVPRCITAPPTAEGIELLSAE